MYRYIMLTCTNRMITCMYHMYTCMYHMYTCMYHMYTCMYHMYTCMCHVYVCMYRMFTSTFFRVFIRQTVFSVVYLSLFKFLVFYIILYWHRS